MALKAILNAYDYAALPDLLKKEYAIQTDGSYRLDLGGMYVTDRDPAGLMSALESEREEHKKTKSHLDRLDREAKDAKRQAELAEAQKKGDLEELRRLFEQQRDDLKKEFEKQVASEKEARVRQQQAVAEEFRKNKAMEIATELFGKRAQVMLPHVMSNLRAIPGETPQIEILNSSGQPELGMTVDSYKKSFLTNPLFKDYIVVSQASGGSANEGTGNVPVTRKDDGSPRAFKDYSPGELQRLKKSSPDEFKQLLESHLKETQQNGYSEVS